MMLHVACDVCRRRYEVDEARLGTELICKECHVPFDVCRQNFFDPDEPEPNSDDPEEEPTASEWREVWAGTVNGVGGAGIIIALGAMLMLLFRDPREAPGPTAADASPTVTQTRDTTWRTAPVQPRRGNRSDDTDRGSDEPLPPPLAEIAEATPTDAPDPLVDPDDSSTAQNPVPEPELPHAEQTAPVRDVQPQRPLALLTINTIDPPRVRPRRTFRVLGTGLSGVERVVLVPTDAPVSAARTLAGFEVVSDGELRVQIGPRPATYVLVLERADVTLVTVPADAHIVSDERSPPTDRGGFVIVRDGGRFEADGVFCCLVEPGGELNCPFSANWAGWFTGGAVITGHHLPPVAWTTPETDLRVTVPDRARLSVTTPSIVAADVEALVTADPSAEGTAEFDGPPPGRRNLRTAVAQHPAGVADVSIRGINYSGPDSIPSSGRRIDDATPLEVGQIVQVEDRRRWYAADVLRVNEDGTVRIHYRGWSDTWDGDVPRSRIQLAHEE